MASGDKLRHSEQQPQRSERRHSCNRSNQIHLSGETFSFSLMPKFGFGKKKEKAPAPAPKVSSSKDLSTRQQQLEARQQERSERKAKREQRKEAAAPVKKETSTKQKSLKPKLSREEQDAKDVKLGCCYYFTKGVAGGMHFIDFIIGFLALIYGCVIDFSGENPAHEVGIVCIVYGLVQIFASSMGVFGFKYKMCKRCGLTFSMYTAPVITTFYFFIIIYFLADQEDVYAYLDEHKDSMYLNAVSLDKLKSLMPLVYIILASLAVAEMVR